MNSRKKARRMVLQALYSWWVSGNEPQDVEHYFLEQQSEEDYDLEYFHSLFRDIVAKVEEIDTFMKPYLNLKLDELDYLEYNLLRLSVYELQFRPDIPYKVIINEALELAKKFGAQDSYKFVNGVLDKIARVVRSGEQK